jgi:hypothetical protein
MVPASVNPGGDAGGLTVEVMEVESLDPDNEILTPMLASPSPGQGGGIGEGGA